VADDAWIDEYLMVVAARLRLVAEEMDFCKTLIL